MVRSQKYFDLFPIEDIQLPPGYKEDDLDDLPPAGQRRGPNRYFAHIRAHKQWKQGIQGYLASIAFADAMVGRVIDALENGPESRQYDRRVVERSRLASGRKAALAEVHGLASLHARSADRPRSRRRSRTASRDADRELHARSRSIS